MKKTLAAIAFAFTASLASSMAAAAPANMTTGGLTSQPIGHYDFCRAYVAECGAIRSGAPVELTPDGWSAMLEVNLAVNRQVQPFTDQEIHGVEEVWSYPTNVGDCEDYVLLKRSELMQRGFAAKDLLITVVLQPDGSGHAVLTVRTDRGDFILDNMRDKVLLWSQTEYTYLKRQASNHAGRWEKINDRRDTMAVGSIR